ncbi:hypothetical protein L7F22_004939 [Adiantum nelumboides]|nr:hypothetical protein [Adiantum nelumboides]
MQSLYDTVNTQMVVAQQLARRLALQSEILNLPPLAKEETESIMNTSVLKLQNMTLQDHAAARTRSRLSSCGPSDFSPVRNTFRSSMQTPSKQAPPAGTRAGLQDSTRRRRDSVDKLWVDVGAAKTTVKRAAPAKRFNRFSSPPARDVVQGNDAQLQNEHLCRDTSPVMTNVSVVKPVPQEEWPRQARTGSQLEGSRAKDSRKPGNSNAGTSQSMKQKVPQLATPATTTTPAQVPQGLQSMSRNSREQESQAIFLPKRTTSVGPSSIGSTTQTTVDLRKYHSETLSNIDVGEKEILEMEAVKSGNHEKGSHSSRKSSLAFVNGSEKRASSSMLQSDATIHQHHGALGSSFMPTGIGFDQSASQVVGSNLMRFPKLQAHSIPSEKVELKESDNNSALEGSKTIIDGHTTRLFSEAGTGSLLTGSSTSHCNMVNSLSSSEQSSGPLFSLQRASLSNSTSQGQGSSIFGPVSLVQPSPPELTRQPWVLSSSESQSSSLPTKFSNFMSPLSSAQEASSASTLALPSAGVCVQTSQLLDVPSVSAMKPNFFDDSIMPAEKSHFSSAASMSTSFLPVQGPPTVSDEEEMEEEGNNVNFSETNSFSAFGLGSSAATTQNLNPFGLNLSSPAASKASNPFGAVSGWNQSSPSSLSAPAGQVFKPAGFSLPTPQLAASSATSTPFNNNLAAGAGSSFSGVHGGFGSSAQPSVSFSNPAQPNSSGQQALGNAFGSFGQTRQIGSPFSASASPSAFGLATGGGFTSATTSGGFASAATGGGFAGVGSSGGFANIGGGGGFASAATGSGFASFSGAGLGGSPSSTINPGSFGAFGGGAFSAFGGGNTNSSIFTQMRK